nr:hypothetical protein [Tanacetum cinerariifolium]
MIKSDQNRTKREACRSREKFKAVAIERGRKTEENKKRMAENAYTYQKLFTFKRKKKRKGPEMQFFQSERKPRKGQNRIKTGQKREVYRSREKFKAVSVGRARKTEQNAKRMVENAYTVKKLFKFKKKEEKKRVKSENAPKFKHKDQFCLPPKVVVPGTSYEIKSVLCDHVRLGLRIRLALVFRVLVYDCKE